MKNEQQVIELIRRSSNDAFLVALQNNVLTKFYTFLATGTLEVTGATTWQKALALAKGKVLDKFAGMDKDVTEVVGFANIMDFYEYLGDKEITTQTQFGLTSALPTTPRTRRRNAVSG